MKLKPYLKYKDSGVGWIGKIPEGWEINRFKFNFKYQKGKIPKNIELEKKDRFLPYLSMDYLRGNSKNATYSLAENGLVTVEENDLLLLWDGSNAGEFVIGKKGILSSTMAKITLNNINRNFAQYVCLSFEPILRDLTTGMGIPHVKTEILDNIRVPLPSDNEQTEIAEFLTSSTSKINEAIEQKQRLIELLEEEKTALINPAVTKGLDPKAPMKDSGVEWLGKIPKHWEVKRLKYIAPSINEKEDPNKYSLKIALENIESNTGKLILVSEDVEFSGDLKKFQRGDVLFNKLRPYLAKVWIANQEGVCVTDLLILRPLSEIDGNFLFYRMLSKSFIDIISGSTEGAKMPRADWDFIGTLSVPLPPFKEQQQIVDYITKETTKINQTINKIKKEIELLQEYRTALISEAVTGKIDVRGIV